ncbi:putative enoyl reductase [Zancudomyces culisetae]|uniref:Putative enoyl reductase n=1 Tax=Zancudomyces culisetae TaxID=1213189 RepID=A0A1R1PEA4_ZANCU|nr:putative enoyl reductase [Zancudomyces culisetae]|eukprot:OMH79248.1 putative enoyl reductase [Zancudomyces culisetae]
MKIQVQKAKGSFSFPVELSDNAVGKELRTLVSKKVNVGFDRVRLTIDTADKKKVVINDNDLVQSVIVKALSLSDTKEISKQETIVVQYKDLGPQISWRTVFLVEYFGPMAMHLLVYNLPKLFYGAAGNTLVHTTDQRIMLYMVLGHYMKRELETLFVHKFSHATMPLSNLFKNSFHYHFTGGLFLAYFCYSPYHTSVVGSPLPSRSLMLATLSFLFFEASNLVTHMNLSSLRPKDGSTERKIPYGYGFDLVTCPNYFYEIMSWVAFSGISRTWASYIFIGFSAYQMVVWAIKKHKIYKKEFPNYPKDRKIIFPYVF